MRDDRLDVAREFIPTRGSARRYVSLFWFVPVVVATGIVCGVCVLAWAFLYDTPDGAVHAFGAVGPVDLYVWATTPVAVVGIWGCANMILKRRRGRRRPYAAPLGFSATAALVLALGSVGALIFSSDPGPILKLSGNLAAVSVILVLLFAKLRSVDATDEP